MSLLSVVSFTVAFSLLLMAYFLLPLQADEKAAGIPVERWLEKSRPDFMSTHRLRLEQSLG
jgi:hypothetical protein